MSDQFRLVFSAEVLSGQHPAVVKKRLQAVLKLDDERMAALFSGKAVVVKKSADEATAVRYQGAFEKAGARLRVLPVEGSAAGSPAESPSTAAIPAAIPESRPQDSSTLDIMPPGSDILAPDERKAAPNTDVDTSHLSLQGAVFDPDPEAGPSAPPAPNVDHLTLAEVGEIIANLEQPPAPQPPDTSHLSVDEPK